MKTPASILVLVLGAASLCSAGVMGSLVDVTANDPDMGTVYIDGGDQTVNGTVEYPTGTFAPGYPSESIEITDTQVIVSLSTGGASFSADPFNGFEIAFLTGTLTGAVVDGSSDFDPVITIDGNDLYLNYSGDLDLTSGEESVIDLTGTAPVVPEPATPLLASLGGAAVLFLAARRR